VLVVDGATGLLAGDRLVLLDPDQAPPGERLFLGEDQDGTPYFACWANCHRSKVRGTATVREVGHLLDDWKRGCSSPRSRCPTGTPSISTRQYDGS